MPTYEYKCDACGTAFERFQSIKAAPVRKCPHCGKARVRRLISGGAGLIFRGSGFYITDYRSDSYKTAASADNGGGKPAEPATKAPTAGGSGAAVPAGTSSDKPAPSEKAPTPAPQASKSAAKPSTRSKK